MSDPSLAGTPDPETPEAGLPGSPAMPANLRAAHPSVVGLDARFGDAILAHELVAGDEHVVFIDPDRSFEILQWLREDPDQNFNYLSDVTAVDYGGGRPLQVVYQLFSIPHRRHLRLKAELPLDGLEIESIVPIWESANWLEREVWDMFGVTFRNHPDPRRILMPEGYQEGHPLRKDFPLRGRFSRAEQTRRALSQDPEDYYVPSEMGPGRTPQLVPWQEFAGGRAPMSTQTDPSVEEPRKG
ncbi:hypothetical protein BH23GEM11_BH23GEM11_12910 [soil metagenome]